MRRIGSTVASGIAGIDKIEELGSARQACLVSTSKASNFRRSRAMGHTVAATSYAHSHGWSEPSVRGADAYGNGRGEGSVAKRPGAERSRKARADWLASSLGSHEGYVAGRVRSDRTMVSNNTVPTAGITRAPSM